MWTSSSNKYRVFIGLKTLIVGRCLGLEAVKVPDSLSSWACRRGCTNGWFDMQASDNSDGILEIGGPILEHLIFNFCDAYYRYFE